MRGTTLKRRGATVLADLPGLRGPAERTTIVRIALVLALAATLGGTILLARSAGSGRAALLPEGVKTGVIVVDMSGSESGLPFERVATVLRALAAANQAMGLVMFSDTAYELLPPNSPASSLLEFERFFNPQSIDKGSPIFGITPWAAFSAGRGSREGCAWARQRYSVPASRTDRSSSSATSTTAPPTRSRSSPRPSRSRRHDVPLRIVPVVAAPPDVKIFRTLFGLNSFVVPSAYKTTSTEQVQPVTSSLPWALISVGAILVGLLAANELFNTRLRPEGAAT